MRRVDPLWERYRQKAPAESLEAIAQQMCRLVEAVESLEVAVRDLSATVARDRAA